MARLPPDAAATVAVLAAERRRAAAAAARRHPRRFVVLAIPTAHGGVFLFKRFRVFFGLLDTPEGSSEVEDDVWGGKKKVMGPNKESRCVLSIVGGPRTRGRRRRHNSKRRAVCRKSVGAYLSKIERRANIYIWIYINVLILGTASTSPTYGCPPVYISIVPQKVPILYPPVRRTGTSCT